jgi:hypothetical protein
MFAEMKLRVFQDEAMLCGKAYRHMGEPAAVAIDHDVVTAETKVRAASIDKQEALPLEPSQWRGYNWLFAVDEPPLEPAGYRLRPNPDGSLTVDLTPCPT